MKSSLREFETALKASLDRSVYVEKGDDGVPCIVTPFAFADGDEPVIAIVRDGGGWSLSDLGNTLLRLSFRLDEREYDHPDTRREIDDAIAMARIRRRGGELTLALAEPDCAADVFEFARALMRIDELGASSRPHYSRQSGNPQGGERERATPPADCAACPVVV